VKLLIEELLRAAIRFTSGLDGRAKVTGVPIQVVHKLFQVTLCPQPEYALRCQKLVMAQKVVLVGNVTYLNKLTRQEKLIHKLPPEYGFVSGTLRCDDSCMPIRSVCKELPRVVDYTEVRMLWAADGIPTHLRW